MTGEILPKVYIKVFYRRQLGQGLPYFFRDGYTDICGKFEFANADAKKLKEVGEFAILVSSKQFGSKLLQCAPPKFDESSMTDSALSSL